MDYQKSIKNSAMLVEVKKVRNLFRIEKLGVVPADNHSYIYKATLYSDAQTLNVTWLSKEERNDLSYGVLVRGEWLTRRIFAQGTNIIKSLERVKSLSANESIANTVMKKWIYDGFAYAFVFDYFEGLPISYRRLVMQILCDHFVLFHFLKTPINLEGDLSQLGSNFQKTAELLDFLCRYLHAHKFNAPREVLLTAGLLLGIGHYNKFKFDHKTQCYHHYDLTHVHDPKIVATGLIYKAAEHAKNIDLEVINRVVEVIDQMDYEYQL